MSIQYTVIVASSDITSDTQAITINRSLSDVAGSPEVGECSIGVTNFQGSLSPEISGLNPNDPIEIKAQDTSTGSSYQLFNGFARSYRVDPELSNRALMIEGQDRAAFFSRKVNVAMKIDTEVGSLVADVLQSIGMKTKEFITSVGSDIALNTDITTSAGSSYELDREIVDSDGTRHGYFSVSSVPALQDTVPFAAFDDVTANNAIGDLLATGAHRFFVARDGTNRIIQRNGGIFRSSQNSYNNSFMSLGYSLTSDNVFNEIRISSTPRKPTTDVRTIAWIESSPEIRAGESIKFFLDFKDPNTDEARTPANSVATPVQSADWSLNTSQDGTGTNVTSQGSLSANIFTRSAQVEITNSTSNTAYLTKMQIRGYPLQQQPTFTQVTEVASSQAQYNVSRFDISTELIDDQTYASNYADYLSLLWHDARPDISMAPDKNLIPDVLDFELSEGVSITEENTGVDAKFLITSIEHEITQEQGWEHVARLGVEREAVDLGGYLVLDHPTFGKLDQRRLAF